VLGLEVDDVDFVEGELSVRRKLKMHKGRPPYLDRPKTTTSARTVELPNVVASALRSHLERDYPPGSGGHFGWEPVVTAASAFVPELYPRPRSFVRPGHGLKIG
jgi:integrase